MGKQALVAIAAAVALLLARPVGAWHVEVAGGGATYEGLAAAVNSADDIVAAGYLKDDFAVVKIAGAGGEIVWKRKLRGTTRGPNSAEAIALDPAENIVVGGSLYNQTSYHDFAVFKLATSDGSVVWRYQTGGPGFHERAHAVAADADGNVFAAGSTESGTHDFLFTVVKLAGTSGTELWRYDVPGYQASALAFVDGDVVVAGALTRDFVVVRLSGTSGSEQWRYTVPASTYRTIAGAVAVDAAGDIVAAGATEVGAPTPSTNFSVVKLSGATGAEVWRRDIDGTAVDSVDTATSLALDETGDVVAAGWLENTATGTDLAVVKLAGTTGVELWRREIHGTATSDSFDAAAAVALDGAGNAFVTGVLDGESTSSDFAILKFAGATGAEEWREVVNGRGRKRFGSGASDNGNAIALLGTGNPVAVGQTARQYPNPFRSAGTSGLSRHALVVVQLAAADGADVAAGRLLELKDDRLTLRVRDGIGISPETAADPTSGGGLLEVRNPTTGEYVSVPLVGWQRDASASQTRGFSHNSASCSKVKIKANRGILIRCSGTGFSLDEPSQGSLAVRLTTGAGAGARRYCFHFGGRITDDRPGRFIAREAPAPASCPFP